MKSQVIPPRINATTVQIAIKQSATMPETATRNFQPTCDGNVKDRLLMSASKYKMRTRLHAAYLQTCGRNFGGRNMFLSPGLRKHLPIEVFDGFGASRPMQS